MILTYERLIILRFKLEMWGATAFSQSVLIVVYAINGVKADAVGLVDLSLRIL